MKKSFISIVVIAVIATFFWAFVPVEEAMMDELAIGAKAPLTDVELEDVSGKMVTLAEVAGENGLLVNFSCNTCPWVARWEDRYNPIAKLAGEHGIGTIALNPNSGYRDRGESMEDMQQRAEKSGYEFFYALDENSRLAQAFGATRTPHIFLFNSDMELVYRGAIDDNAGSAKDVENHYLKDAIRELSAGKEITNKTTKSLGCTIKWPS